MTLLGRVTSLLGDPVDARLAQSIFGAADAHTARCEHAGDPSGQRLREAPDSGYLG